MTQEEKRIKLAEADNYKRDEVSDCWRKGDFCFFLEDPLHLRQLPDYFNDLNAVHEFWKLVIYPDLTLMLSFERTLLGITKTEASDPSRAYFPSLLTNATAAQRAEALGITLGLWKDGE